MKKPFVMKTHSIFLVLIIALSNVLFAQTDFETFDGNNIKTVFSPDGVFFWDLNDGRFQVPIDSPDLNSIFSGGLWLGGIDDGGQLKVAAETYRQNGNDFWAGPLDATTGLTDNNTVNAWSRVWKVNKSEIDQHIADFNDNGIINYAQPSIVEWPGEGNVHAKGKNGDAIQVNQELAPFVDLNNNGIYEPYAGEYPDIKGDQMLWYVFNDFGPSPTGSTHEETGGMPLGIECHISVYGYNCPTDDILYNTLFIDYKFINRLISTVSNNTNLNDFYIGKWIDFDLGCFNDDYIGCDTVSNTFYVYNGNLIDSTCGLSQSQGYFNDPPIQTVTFLNQELNTFSYYNNDFTVFGNPEYAIHYYNYLKGLWKNNTPLIRLNGDTTSYFFPGNPSDPSDWSECSSNNTPGDRRGVGATGPHSLAANESIELTVAYSTHFLPYNGCPDFTPYRQRIQYIQNKFDNNDLQACSFSNLTCPDPNSLICVWPGDANNDGVATIFDILPIGIAYGTSGPIRPNASNNWEGQPMQYWPQNFSIIGENYKHADCNGDGLIDSLDFSPVLDNYGLLHQKETMQFSVNGIPLVAELQPDTFAAGTQISVDIKLGDANQTVQDFYGMAFTMMYNSSVVQPGSVSIDLSNSWAGTEHVDLEAVHKEFPTSNRIDIALTRIDQNNVSGHGRLMTVNFILIDDIAGVKYSSPLLESFDPWISSAKAIKNDETEIDIYLSNEDLELNPKFKIYPNPNNGTLYVEIPQGSEIEQVRLFDNTGRSLFEMGTQDKDRVELNTSNYPTGIYFLEVKSQNGSQVHKVSVIR